MNEGENILNKVLDFLMKIVFLVCACISIAAVITICVFMFANGVPAIKEIGITKFLFGTQWRVSQNLFGIWPMIVGSIYVTAGAMIIGVPIGLLTAVFLAKYCPKKLWQGFLLLYTDSSDWLLLFQLFRKCLEQQVTVYLQHQFFLE